MLSVIKNRIEQGNKTNNYPREKIKLPAQYRGRPVIDATAPEELVQKCVAACPQDAIDAESKSIDLGRCLFCGECARVSENKFISFSNDYELAVATAEELIFAGKMEELANHSKQHFKKLFGRSLQLRQVSAAGCNSCEADLNVLATPFFDLARFGINFVASPRHADGIVVTGPISKNMKKATLQTLEAVPSPKVVIAVGSCAISGGPFRGSPEISLGLDSFIPVDLFIPGCPPHPMSNLHALLSYFK